jgi:excinuclease ABC subunit B
MELEKQMKNAAKALEFEKAAALRDQVIELRRALVSDTESLKELAAVAGQDGVVPFSDAGTQGGRRTRGVSYRPGRRGARYRR